LTSHFSAEELASYRAGEIGADRAAGIPAHLADCARCAGVDSDLAEVSALLASLPVPPMPDRLTERVSAAIAAEAEQRAAGLNAVRAGQSANSVNADVDLDDGRSGVPEQTGPVNVPGRPDLPERSRRRQGRARRAVWTSPLVMGGLAATGVFAFVVVGAVYALSQSGLGSSSSSAPRAAGAIPKPGPRDSSSSGQSRSGAHSPVYGVGNPAYSTTGVQLKYNALGKTRTATVYASPARYTRGNIARGVRSGLTIGLNLPDAGPAHTGPTGTHHPQPHKVGSVSFGQLAGCLSAVAPANGVLIVEIAHYLGKQAIIVVGRPVAKAYQVTVTGLACSAGRPDVVARITVPEPR
jgi:hypothetical protein